MPERVEQLKRSVTAYIYAAAAACHASSLKRCNAGVLGFEGCNTSRLRADFTERARTVRRGGLGILLAGVAEYDLSQKAPDRPASSHERLSAIEQPPWASAIRAAAILPSRSPGISARNRGEGSILGSGDDTSERHARVLSPPSRWTRILRFPESIHPAAFIVARSHSHGHLTHWF